MFSFCSLYSVKDTIYSPVTLDYGTGTFKYYWLKRNFELNRDLSIFQHAIYQIYNNGDNWAQMYYSLNGTAGIYISNDGLKSIDLNLLLLPKHSEPTHTQSILKNNKMIFTSLILDSNNINQQGVITEYNIVTKEKKTHILEMFKDKAVMQTAFKDTLTGLMAVADSSKPIYDSLGIKRGLSSRHNIYKTVNGLESWYRLDSISDILISSKLMVNSLDYFEQSNKLVCTLDDRNTRKSYWMYSNNFGETWSDIKLLPRGDYKTMRNMRFYITNDSVWFTASTSMYPNSSSGLEFMNMIYFSPNMGQSWEAQLIYEPERFDSYSRAIEFYDNSSVGFFCENSRNIYFTVDGGKIWRLMKDSVSNFGMLKFTYDRDEQNVKYKLVKSNNKMYFFGFNKVYMLNALELPSGIKEDVKKSICNFYFSNRDERIEIFSKNNENIRQVVLYDINGREFYNSGNIYSNYLYINREYLKNTKLVLAKIQMDTEIIFGKIMCE